MLYLLHNMRIHFLAALAIVVPACAGDITSPGGGGDDDTGAVCGNGSLDTGETCDDGNTAAGDGCMAAIDAERWLESQGITEANTLTAW